MSDSKNILKQFKDILGKIENKFAEQTPDCNINHLKTQLLGVEQTITKLNKKNVQIPDELRNLKIKLINDIDNLKADQELRRETIALCKAYLKKQKQLDNQNKPDNDSSPQLKLFND